MSEDKLPRVLVLGGTGFIGRHLVKYIVENNFASKVRVADKTMPALAFMNPEFKNIFANPIVEFKQANLSNPAHVKRAFTDDAKWDYVVNLAAETRYGLDENTYKQMAFDIAVNCAKEAVAVGGMKKYIEVSTAQVYNSDHKHNKETDKLKPWTKLAHAKAEAEEEINKLADLPLIILRPAIVYGPSDQNGITPRIVVAASYAQLKKKMKLLWTGDLSINTVHVRDVAKAIWWCFQNANKGDIFNLADKNDTTQKKLNTPFEEIFKIKTGFQGAILSSLAKLKMKEAVEYANDKHMTPWNELCKAKDIKNTPLSPYLDIELLNNNPLSIDGSAIEKKGFVYDHPVIKTEYIQEVIDDFKALNLFPAWN